MNTLALNLGALMERQSISQNTLAEATGIPQPTIGRILAGTSNSPRDSTLLPIARHFGLTVEDLRRGDVVAPDGQSRSASTGEDAASSIASIWTVLIVFADWIHETRPVEARTLTGTLTKAAQMMGSAADDSNLQSLLGALAGRAPVVPASSASARGSKKRSKPA